MNRPIKFLLLALFVCAVLFIVFLQFNSSRSINQLIKGNETLLQQTQVKHNLQKLETDINILESKVRGAVISGAALDTGLVDKEIQEVNDTYNNLQSLEADSIIEPLLKDLDRLLRSKIEVSQSIISAYSQNGKQAAEQLVNTGVSARLIDSIKITTSRIDELHQFYVTELIKEADNNGRKAKALGTIMAGIAAIASIFTFLYVAFKIRQQQQLIERLNISEKRAKDAVQIKENFLANMSHEIRTPMNAVLGFTNLLQREELSNKAKGYVQTIQRSSEKLLTIINDILDLSKIEAGMMRIETVSFSIRALLQSIEEMFQPKALEKGLRLTTSVEESLPDMLEGDALRLTQVLVNLIGNAIKFTNSGKITVFVNNRGIQEDIVNTGIEVKDEGIGIAPEKLPGIFNRFQQAEESVTRKYGGTGLGLAIVQELIKLQNGTISVESLPGSGTTFKLILPYKISTTHSNDSKRTNAVPDFTKGFGNTRVLVAEDNEINQNLIKNLFLEWDIIFDMAENGKEAIELLKINNYNMVLMDMQMPEMDGYTAALIIRKELHLSVPIIAMTAHAMAGEREKCLSYGMNEYISKPIREEQLRKLINQFTKVEISTVKNEFSNADIGNYQFIDLAYLKEISVGNIEYEKTVTQQFIEAIPDELAALKKYWDEKDIHNLKLQAHNMKTTVSVMGLNEKLNPYLDALEHEDLTAERFSTQYAAVNSICTLALAEAKGLYASFN